MSTLILNEIFKFHFIQFFFDYIYVYIPSYSFLRLNINKTFQGKCKAPPKVVIPYSKTEIRHGMFRVIILVLQP